MTLLFLIITFCPSHLSHHLSSVHETLIPCINGIFIVDNREKVKKINDGFITNEEDEDEDELNVASDQFIIENPLCNMGILSEDMMADAGCGRGRGRLETQEEYL